MGVMPNIVIDFCGGCGVQLPEDMGTWSPEDQHCENCNHDVYKRENRLQGTFTQTDGQRMLVIYRGE